MARAQQYCSTPDQLLTFLRGQLSLQEETELQLHLDECVSCQERLEHAAADLSEWSEAREFLGRGALRSSLAEASDDHEETSQGTLRIQQILDALAPTDDPESLGRIGGYEVKGVVGAGGMGVVLKAHDRSLDRIVAIKVMSPHLAENGSARKRFAREAKAAAAVLHPNVIAIHSVASENTTPYLVMPFVRGASLQNRIDLQGPLPLKDTLRIGAQIAAGLAAAHGQGLVHRDIKPANILLEEGVERVTITDFGLARAVDDASMTCSGVIAGTPQYMSPEQTRGEPVDARSDLFSLGSVLYAMCAGRAPFRAETTYGVLHRIANDRPTPVCDINSDVPVWLGCIIDRLMAKRPDDRFESAAQVAELLEGCLAHVQQPAAIPLPSAVTELLPSRIRRPPIGKLIAAAAGVCALVVLGIVIILELNKGTLIIESESDDVPIRIVQGDQVVERLTVTKSGNSIRIAAGTYVVELDTELDGMVVENEQVSLKRGTTENIRIRIANQATDSNAVSDTDGPRFDNPEDLMQHAAECQIRNDTTGFMACWTDEPVKQIATSYLLMSIMQLQEFQSNGSANRPPGYVEQIAELTKILAEEIHDKDAATSAAALAIAQKEIADRSKDDFNETAEASMTSPLTRVLAIATIDRITNPRSFVARIAALHEKYEAPPENRRKKNYTYAVEQEGNTAVATETTSNMRLGLVRTVAGWRINDLWHGLDAQELPKISVDLYGGKDVMAQMNTNGPNKAKHVKLFQELNAIEGVVVNFLESGAGNEIALAIINDPAGSLNQESQLSGKPSERRVAISRALEQIPSVRWEEGNQASVGIIPPAEKTPEPAEEAFRLSEPREIVLSIGTLNCMLDLDTGEICPAPARLSEGLKIFDIRPTQDQPQEEPRGLTISNLDPTTPGFTASSVSPELWNCPDSEVISKIATSELGPVEKIQFNVGGSNTHLFKTAQGTRGLLEIMRTERISGEVNEPWGIRIRYKTLPAADSDRSLGSVKCVNQYLEAVCKDDTETIRSIVKGVFSSEKATREVSSLIHEQGIPKLSQVWGDQDSAVVTVGPVSSSDERADGHFLVFRLALEDERWSIIRMSFVAPRENGSFRGAKSD